MRNIFKLIVISFFIFTSYASSEVIKFSSSTYEGELKNGKAHGFGTLTFTDGTKYVGEFKKNIIHGNGKYIDLDGNITSGKWTHGKIRKKIDINNREVVKLNILTGKVNYFETKGSGGNNLWFEAVPKVVSAEEIAAANQSNIELDIFDTPSVFSTDYGNEDKIKELLAEKIEKVSAEDNKLNNGSSKIAKNNNIVYVLTEKGQRDKQSSEQTASNTTGQTETQVATSSSSSGSGGSGGSGSGC